MLSDQSIHGFLLLAPVFIVSLTLHELAHGLRPTGWATAPPRTWAGSRSTRSRTWIRSAR